LIAPKEIDDEHGPPTRCDHDGCDAGCLTERRCIEHATEKELDTAVERWHRGEPLDARDATIDCRDLKRLLGALATSRVDPELAALDPDQFGASCFGAVLFDKTTFVGCADFTGVSFVRAASFDGATFSGPARFCRAEFGGHADFDGVTFCGPADFTQVTFSDHAGFQGATFESAATFDSAKFRSYADFEDTLFKYDAAMRGATFQLAHQVGPLLVQNQLSLDECVFAERVNIDADATRVSARAAIFADGVRLSLRRAAIELECTDFGRSSTVSHATEWKSPAGRRWSQVAGGDPAAQPKLLTLRGAQVAALSISGLDLSECRFFGAHGLESLIVEPSCEWPHTSRRIHCVAREMIAEELNWRYEKVASSWLGCLVQRLGRRTAPSALSHEDGLLKPEQLAALYRSLRKAREDNNDQAGASDLYYGEMEMRRHTPAHSGHGWARARADKLIITQYWALAGYGLRATRALSAFAGLILLAAILLDHCGFTVHATYWQAAWFAAKSSVSLVHVSEALPSSPEAHLSTLGEIIGVGIRVAGPILLGLAALSLRSRIKR
jgi:uncharacterized protein YjbI with pentapeptide repeats